MVNVKELERRWIQYKIKKLIPFATALIILIGCITVYFIFTTSSQKTTPEIKTKNISHTITTIKEPVTKIEPKPLLKKPHIQIKETQKVAQDPQLLKPSFDFLQKMKYSDIVPNNKPRKTHTKTLKKSVPKFTKPPKTTQKTPQEIKISTTIKKDKPKSQIKPLTLKNTKQLNIQTKHISEDELQQIIQRFKKTNNPHLSLFIAKKYYDMGNYNKAYNYALITNEIDNKIEESWLIFVKSLIKLGHKKRAIKTLEAYIEYSSSNRAKLLLNNINTGKFK